MRKPLQIFLTLFIYSMHLNAQVVISQVYGGGGNTGATIKQDFIELFNRGNTSVSIGGWSVQYASATGSTWAVTNLSNVSLAPGQYYLIQQAAGLGGTLNLNPDTIGIIAMSAAAGKVALVNNTTALSGTCPTSASIQDLVGFGTTATCSETSPTSAPSNTTAVLRNSNGCTDSGNNNGDFTVGSPNPSNRATTLAPCGGSPAISASVVAGSNLAEPSTNGSFNINLSANAPAGGTTITYTFSGSASFNTDYSDPLSGSITISAGSNSVAINLNVLDDPDFEGTESIQITLNSATNGVVIGTSTTNLSISDNEVNPTINLTTNYCQDFNTLASSGTSSVLPQGWNFVESSTNANALYSAGTGSGTGGDTYSFGNFSDRALGTLQSGSLLSTIGAQIKNTSGSIITKLKVSYKGEQWRLGTVSRKDSLLFQYSTDASSLTTGTWTTVSQLHFATPNIGTVGAKDGNDPLNFQNIVYTIRNLNIPGNAVFFIRWSDFNASGSDDGLAVDSFCIEANPVDLIAPAVTSIVPTNGAIDVPYNTSASISYNEDIIKGTGNIIVKKSIDNSVVKSIDVNSAAVQLANNTLSFLLNDLLPNTSYYFELPGGLVKDLDENPSITMNGNSNWAFTTGSKLFYTDMSACTNVLSDGFSQYSQVGSIIWACTTFGHDPNDLTGLASLANGMQINGFSGGTNVPNTDWLISPSFDLTGTTYPLVSFWSRTAFNGMPLKLKVSADYVSGDPSTATWVDLNGKFPTEASNSWTLSENINLTAYKQSNVHIAFLYESSDEDGARWTLDDFTITNSPTPPPPSLTVNPVELNFPYTANGGQSIKTISVIGNDLINGITINSTGQFGLSKTGSGFSNSISYTLGEANNSPLTVYVSFNPNLANQNFSGNLNIQSGALSSYVSLAGTSIDPATTLEVVNWNIEWFGSAANGPTNDEQQKQNVITIFQSVNADIYALAEVVDTTRLRQVVNALSGYDMIVGNFGSHTNTTDPEVGSLSEAQKLAFIYKKSLLTNISATPLLSLGVNSAADLTNPAWNYWSSGRFPYMLSADVTLNCVTRHMKFVLVHAKANTSPTATSYDRRKKGADTLHYLLATQYPNAHIVILGDYNDDLDQSITAGFTTTSWSIFKNDPLYSAITLPLSLAGKKSTVSHDNVIDHVVISDEVADYYLHGSANILSDVASLVNNFGSSTSDHYPVFSRYRFNNTTAPTNVACTTSVAHCINNTGIYTIPLYTAMDDCNDAITYTYTITGATSRGGNTNNASGSFNVGVSTIYWEATDSWGNYTTCTTTVTINTLPSCIITTSTPLITAKTIYLGYGEQSISFAATVTGTGPFTYLWSGSSALSCTGCAAPVFSPTSCGNYTIQLKLTDVNGCMSSCSYMVKVIDARVPGQEQKVILCHNGNTVEVAAVSVQAHLDHGDVLGSCIGTCNNFQDLTPVQTSEPTIKINYYPNPSTDVLNIELISNNTSKIYITVKNSIGQTMQIIPSFKGSKYIQLGTSFARGLYFVDIIQGNKRKVIKWLKE